MTAYRIELVADYWHVSLNGILISTHTLRADAERAIRHYEFR
jgi:hypothetical protein